MCACVCCTDSYEIASNSVHPGPPQRAWTKNYDCRRKDRFAATGQAAYSSLIEAAVAHPTTQLQPPPSPEPQEDTPPPTSSGGEEDSAGGGQLLSLLAAAAADTAPTPTPTPPPQPAPPTNSTAAPAKRARCSLLDELLSQAAAKKAARLAGSEARAAGGGGVVGTHMVVAQPKRPHGKPASWMLRHDAPALLTPEEFKALSLPALQRLWGEYYVWMGAGERADGSKSGNRSYLQRKLVAA